ncbi:hypothetical protein XELAEV_18008299mg [Xenopus laevis]|uniref:Uncharacterized protein n=1 Tax=Xenopus laevis TaxID=8355 RepID=A0A974E3X1_XENLA|nr:hypothetical protein XELAEV_18008299mg [Xenopus laevis]
MGPVIQDYPYNIRKEWDIPHLSQMHANHIKVYGCAAHAERLEFGNALELYPFLWKPCGIDCHDLGQIICG